MVTRERWKMGIGIFVIFLLGAGAGSLATGIYMKQSLKEFMEGGREARRAYFLKKMTKALDLSTEQMQKVEEIMKQSHIQFREIKQTLRPQLMKMREERISAIKAVLKEDQIEKADRFFERMKELWKKRRGNLEDDGENRNRPH